jgi:hypothetical protein
MLLHIQQGLPSGDMKITEVYTLPGQLKALTSISSKMLE